METILAKAEKSEQNESFHLLASGDHFRLGVTARFENGLPQFSIELYLCVMQKNSEVELKLLEKAVRLVNKLNEFGYAAFHQDDGWIVIDKTTDRAGINTEIDILLKIVANNEKLN